MKRLLIPLIACCCVAFMDTDCKHNPVGPGDTTHIDTTSHIMQWMVDTLGTQGWVRDVWVFSRDNAWAVGEIYLNDSTGHPNMANPYNAAHWDGIKWTIKQITVNFRGHLITPPIDGIFAFSPNQIWLAGGLTIYGDGSTWTPYDVRLITGFDTLDCEKCWGTSSSNMYFVGSGGSIAHYNGSSWMKMTSTTTCDLQDIYGLDATHIWATGFNEVTGQSAVLQYNGTNWSTLYDNSGKSIANTYAFCSVWTYTSSFIYLTGGYLQTLTFSDSVIIGNPIKTGLAYTSTSIRGVNQNDIFIVTEGGEVAHYNGVNWHTYLDLQAFNASGAWFTRVYSTSNFILIGGVYYTALNGFPVVIRGYR